MPEPWCSWNTHVDTASFQTNLGLSRTKKWRTQNQQRQTSRIKNLQPSGEGKLLVIHPTPSSALYQRSDQDNPTSTELDMYWHVYIYHYLSCVLNHTDPQESAKLTNFPPTESKFPQLGGNPWGWVRRAPSCAAYDSPHLEGLDILYILPKSIQNKPPPSQLRPKEADRIHVRTRPWPGI